MYFADTGERLAVVLHRDRMDVCLLCDNVPLIAEECCALAQLPMQSSATQLMLMARQMAVRGRLRSKQTIRQVLHADCALVCLLRLHALKVQRAEEQGI